MTNNIKLKQLVKNTIKKAMKEDLLEMTDDFIGDVFCFEINEYTLQVENFDVPTSNDIKYFDFLFKKNNIEYKGTESYMELYQFYSDKVSSEFLGK